MMPMLPLIRFESSLSMYAKGQEISEYGIIRQKKIVDMRLMRFWLLPRNIIRHVMMHPVGQ